MIRPGGRAWTYHVGRSHHNRVTVFCVNRAPGICMDWWQDGRRRRQGLGHRDRAKAMAQAIEKANELGTKRPSVERLVAMRSDLARVAKLQGYPEGVSPSVKVYLKQGVFGFRAVQGVFRGYRDGQPRDSWKEAMHRFGFRSPYEQRRPTEPQVQADIRGVAHAVGAPRRMPSRSQYDRLGSWDIDTAMTVLGLPWDRIADALGLEMEWWRRAASERQRQPRDSETRAA